MRPRTSERRAFPPPTPPGGAWGGGPPPPGRAPPQPPVEPVVRAAPARRDHRRDPGQRGLSAGDDVADHDPVVRQPHDLALDEDLHGLVEEALVEQPPAHRLPPPGGGGGGRGGGGPAPPVPRP